MSKNLFFTLVLLFFSCQMFAWGTIGHQVVAEIAERNLSNKTKREIKKLLGNEPLAYWANWADEIKSDTTKIWKNTFKWHYVNIPSGLSFDLFTKELKGYKSENLYSAILKNQEILKNKKLSLQERKTALLFLIHLLGDMEQPMHVGKKEDLGGNKIKTFWFSKPANLHSVWDSKLIDYYKYSYTEYASILNIHCKRENKKRAQGTLEEWIFDSYKTAEVIYSEIDAYKKLDFQYAYYNKSLLENQLLKGGLRLAKVLNSLLG